MATYHIISRQGQDMGTFSAPSQLQALDALCREAGYEDQADADRQTGSHTDWETTWDAEKEEYILTLK